jgi:hypothetical protein
MHQDPKRLTQGVEFSNLPFDLLDAAFSDGADARAVVWFGRAESEQLRYFI